MQVHLTLRQRGIPDRDLAIEAPPATSLAAVQSLDASCSPSRAGWWAGTRRLGLDAALGGPGLRDGDIIGVGQVGVRDSTAGAVLLVHAVGGPDAGGLWALPTGLLIVGRSDDADVRLRDGDLSRRHASLTVTSAGVMVRDLESTNGTLLDGEAIGPDGASLRPGQLMQVGNTILCLAAVADAPAALRPHGDAKLLMNRPPRGSIDAEPPTVAFPPEPAARTRSSLRLAAMLAPAVIGAAMATIMRSPVFLLFAVLSPITALANWINDRVAARRGRRRDSRAFRRAEAEAETRRDELLTAEASLRRRAHPDPAAVRLIARGPTSRLWERRQDDADFLDVRVGLGDAPARLRLTRASAPLPAPTLGIVPRHASLRDGPLGICGPMTAALAAARWAVVQLATLHSSADLRVVALLGEAQQEQWRWLRWLPHTQSIATDASSRRLVVQQLRDMVEAAPEHPRGSSRLRSGRGPWTVLIVDRAGELADTAGLSRLLRDGPVAGVTAICIDDSTRRLPGACANVLEVESTAIRAVLRRPHDAAGADVLLDGMRLEHADEAARRLASVIDPSDEQAAIPASARMTDALGPGAFEPAALAKRWAASHGVPRTAIGIGARGLCELDLVRDGPHALIAGTTGAGKSELLQSLIAGLASRCSPEDLAFLLIDYKGGAAFARCAELPHTAGLVTDLDQSMAERALRSLHAELRRREAILSANGAADLLAYRAAAGAADEPLPRIVLVVDEFAALVEELPSFVGGLVGIAQRGRSLGVHMVLATQRPGGVVSPEIRANTNLRIALRVTDPSESRDVVGVDDAARLPRARPGRALVRIGSSSEPPLEMQTMHAAAPARADGAVTIHWLDGWRRPRARGSSEAASRRSGPTELDELVRGAREAARAMARPRSPWLPPLTELLALEDVDVRGPGDRVRRLVLGLVDQPDDQRQEPLLVDLGGSTTLIVGAARSGRTSALRLVAHQASADSTCQIHALDCGSGQLRALEASHRCGVFADGDDPDALRIALARLADMVSARRAADQADSCLLLVDGVDAAMASLEAADPGRGADQLLSLLRDAQSGGVTVVATGDRPALAGRLGSAFATKVLLRLNDPSDYTLAGIPSRLVSAAMPAGRGLLAPDGDAVQLAVLDAEPAAQVRMLGEALAGRRGADAPPMMRFRPLPRRVHLRALTADRAPGHGEVVLGVGGDSAQTTTLSVLAPGQSRMLIAGPPGSGRSNALALIAEQLGAQGIPTLLIADAARWQHPMPSAVTVLDDGADPPLTGAGASEPQVILVDDCHALGSNDLGAWLADVAARRPDIAVIGSGRTDELAATFRGVGAVLARARRGVLLCPAPTDPDLFSLRLPRTRAPFRPGRGIAVGPDGPAPVQLALIG